MMLWEQVSVHVPCTCSVPKLIVPCEQSAIWRYVTWIFLQNKYSHRNGGTQEVKIYLQGIPSIISLANSMKSASLNFVSSQYTTLVMPASLMHWAQTLLGYKVVYRIHPSRLALFLKALKIAFLIAYTTAIQKLSGVYDYSSVDYIP